MLNVVKSSKHLDKKSLKEATEEVFSFLGYEFEINLSFVSNEEMKRLNQGFRGKEEPTNVLSFSHDEGVAHGDIVISDSVIEEESKKLGYSEKELILLYLVHGMLHLADFNHTSAKERAKMEKAEEQILVNLGINIDR